MHSRLASHSTARKAARPGRGPARRNSVVTGELREFLKSLPLAVSVLDREASVLFWNAAAERLFGWRAREVLGRPTPLVPRDEFKAFRLRVERDLSVSRRVESVAARLHKDGGRVDVSVYSCPLHDADGHAIGVIRMLADLSEHQQDVRELRQAELNLRRAIGQRDAAVERERTRIARELHDELGQALTAIKMELGLLGRRLPAGDAQLGDKVAHLTGLVDETMRAARRLASELRPALLDVTGLFGAVQLQVQAFERHTGIPCRLDLPARLFEPGAERTTAVFRVLQEILTNVARHAAASRVEIRLRRSEGRLVLQVDDDGRGFDPQTVKADAYGLVGMRERAELLGGNLAISRHTPRGTRVTLTLPLT